MKYKSDIKQGQIIIAAKTALKRSDFLYCLMFCLFIKTSVSVDILSVTEIFLGWVSSLELLKIMVFLRLICCYDATEFEDYFTECFTKKDRNKSINLPVNYRIFDREIAK